MAYTNESRQKLGEALATAFKTAFGRGNSGSEWITPMQYEQGCARVTEMLRGGISEEARIGKIIKEASEAVTDVKFLPLGTPSSRGDSTCLIDVYFDPKVAESIYSDGKNTIASLEKDGKQYIVSDDGTATEVKDADKYVDNLNKSTGSKYKKESLQSMVDEANLALDGTGCSIDCDGETMKIKGDTALIKPTQRALPDPLFGWDGIDGGYNPDTGEVDVFIPRFADENDYKFIEDFLYAAVNIILDGLGKVDVADEDEWAEEINNAAVEPTFSTRYAYAGESFVTGRKDTAKLVKTILQESKEEAKTILECKLGKVMAEAVWAKLDMPKDKIQESVKPHKSAIVDEELDMLDAIHESLEKGLPVHELHTEDLINKNTKE